MTKNKSAESSEPKYNGETDSSVNSKVNTVKNKASKESEKYSAEGEEVLLKFPAGLKYKLPGKRQRIIISSLVVGLNLLLVIAVIVYLYNPSFQNFIYNIGRS